jgi:hypothetical protein
MHNIHFSQNTWQFKENDHCMNLDKADIRYHIISSITPQMPSCTLCIACALVSPLLTWYHQGFIYLSALPVVAEQLSPPFEKILAPPLETQPHAQHFMCGLIPLPIIFVPIGNWYFGFCSDSKMAFVELQDS